jgi:hypothetical protein
VVAPAHASIVAAFDPVTGQTASGQLPQLGATTWDTELVGFTFAGRTFTATGAATFVAANGDEPHQVLAVDDELTWTTSGQVPTTHAAYATTTIMSAARRRSPPGS